MQRRQVHKTAKDTELPKSAKPSVSPTAQRERKREESKSKKQKTLEQKLENLTLEDVKEAKPKSQARVATSGSKDPNSDSSTTYAVGHEPTDVHDIGTSVDNNESTSARDQTRDREDSGDVGRLEDKLKETEEELLKNLEFVSRESEDTREKIKKLTGYMKALEAAPSEINPDDEGASPHPENKGSDGHGTSQLVGDMDPVAQAAILAGIRERESGENYLEGEIMEPMQPSETDPNNIIIVGEIMGPKVHAQLKTSPQEGELTTATAVEPILQSTVVPGMKTVDTNTESEQDREGVKGTRLGDDVLEGTASTSESVEPAPSSHHTPPKKPKIQLAASFMNN